MAIRIVLVMVFLATVLGGIFGWKQHMATQMAAARSGGVLVRSFDGEPALADCIRITIGRPEDNTQLLEAVRKGSRS